LPRATRLRAAAAPDGSIRMKIFFRQAWPRALFVAATVAIAGGIIYAAARMGAAAALDASSNPNRWQLAARLEPGDADSWRRLGLVEQWDFQHGDLHRAAEDFRRAARLNPHLDLNWLDLASVYETLGEIGQARQAYRKAEASHPSSSEVAWRYGSFLLRQGDTGGAGREMRRALENDPTLTRNAVSQCARAGMSSEEILDQVLPRGREYYLPALGYFVGEKQPEAGLAVWKRMMGLNKAFALDELLPFVNLLIWTNHAAQAHEAWQQAVDASGWPRSKSDDSSLIFNGSFEHDLANGGFGWRETPGEGMSFGFDTEVFHSGKRSLKVTFDGGGNYNFNHLAQFVAVAPGQSYRFTAYLRTQDLSTDSGMRFEIADYEQPNALDIRTDNLTGTNAWTLAQVEFTVPAVTHWLRIALRRDPTWKFDNKLRGSVWVDDVALVTTAAPGKGRRR
jgi:Carbohydrate binding domain/Tetratricopeptide repeat